MASALQSPATTDKLTELRLALNPKQCAFVDHYLAGSSATAAYMAAYPGLSESDAAASASRMLSKNANVREYVQRSKLADQAASALSREEKRAMLADLVRVNITEIVGPDGSVDAEMAHLLQELQYSTDKNGNRVITVKLPSKLQAIQIDNQMSGDNAPEEHHHSLQGLLANLAPSIDLPSKRGKASSFS